MNITSDNIKHILFEIAKYYQQELPLDFNYSNLIK